jgi:hypothetical protein
LSDYLIIVAPLVDNHHWVRTDRHRVSQTPNVEMLYGSFPYEAVVFDFSGVVDQVVDTVEDAIVRAVSPSCHGCAASG